MFDFRELKVYKKAKIFHSESKRILKNGKFDKTVTDQLNRASFSTVLNIAEGSGRFSKPDRRIFFVIAGSSIFECVAILDVLHDDKAVTSIEFMEFQKKADELSRILFAMIKNLG